MPPRRDERAESGEGLVRGLGLPQASSIVVGIVIGSGIFAGANRVAQGAGSTFELFAVWLGAGLLTLLGALTYAEFGAMFPRSGGDYVYARESLGPFWGFFNGWLTFSINYPASLAALVLVWAGQLDQLKPGAHEILFFGAFSLKFTALALLLVFVVLNYFGVRQGGWAQLAVTGGKILLVLGLVVLGLTSREADAGNLTAAAPAATAGLATALVGAFWAYDGWTGVTKVAGEVERPQRNLPRALGVGIAGVILLYLLLTLVYLLVLGLDGMRGTGLPEEAAAAIASRTAEAIAGAPGETFVTILILVSILGPINGLTLAGPRVYYAMARDGLFPSALGRVHERHKVPHVSLMFQALLSGLLVIFFTFNQLTFYVVLASWVAYAVTGVALIVLRRRDPSRDRPYKVPLYPAVPLLFVALSVLFVLYILWDSFQALDTTLYFLGNVLAMALSVPVYWFFVRRRDVPAREL